MARECPICGEKGLRTKRGTFRFEPPPNIGGGVIAVAHTKWEECSECGEQILGPELNRALEDESRRRQGLLTPDEIKTIRDGVGLSQVEIAQLLGVGDKTYARWETGKSIQNRANDNLIRLLNRNAERLLLIDAERRPERQREVADYVASLQELKGGNRVGMAAHGGDLSSNVAEVLRRLLRELAEQRRASGG